MQTKLMNKEIPKATSNETSVRMRELVDYDELMNCMRCGFCLPACPTYRETGLEAASPRGRIALMKASIDGVMEADQQVKDQLDLCLGCRACEPACPAGVQYGELLEQSRQAIEEHAEYPKWIQWMRKLAFIHLFPHQKRMRLVGKLIAFYQRSGLQWLTRKVGVMKLFPAHMRGMEAILPQTKGSGVALELGHTIPAQGEKIGVVGMFSGCIMDVMFLETNKNTVRLLSEAGFEVVIPKNQVCCGALHAHSGEREKAKELARQNIAAFKEADVDYIASNAGGCGAILKEYHHLLEDEHGLEADSSRDGQPGDGYADGKESGAQDDAYWFASRIKDISELLLDHSPLRDLGRLDERVTYQGSCHLQNGMGVTIQPQALLQGIEGAEYVELFESERCCGSAGIYNITQPQMAGQILDEKMEHVQQTKADTLVTSNPGCLLQMKLGIHQAGLEDKMRAVHLVDLIAEARLEENRNRERLE